MAGTRNSSPVPHCGTIYRLQNPQKTEAGKAAAWGPGTRPWYTGVTGHCSAALEGPGPAAPAVISGQGRKAAHAARHWSRLLSARLEQSVVKFTCSIRAGGIKRPAGDPARAVPCRQGSYYGLGTGGNRRRRQGGPADRLPAAEPRSLRGHRALLHSLSQPLPTEASAIPGQVLAALGAGLREFRCDRASPAGAAGEAGPRWMRSGRPRPGCS